MVYEGLYIFMCYSSGPQVHGSLVHSKPICGPLSQSPFVDHPPGPEMGHGSRVRKWVTGARGVSALTTVGRRISLAPKSCWRHEAAAAQRFSCARGGGAQRSQQDPQGFEGADASAPLAECES